MLLRQDGREREAAAFLERVIDARERIARESRQAVQPHGLRKGVLIAKTRRPDVGLDHILVLPVHDLEGLIDAIDGARAQRELVREVDRRHLRVAGGGDIAQIAVEDNEMGRILAGDRERNEPEKKKCSHKDFTMRMSVCSSLPS